jgi:hypothetical protein
MNTGGFMFTEGSINDGITVELAKATRLAAYQGV